MGVEGSRAADAAEQALSLVGLAERSRDRVATLSGGMQRRLNIAAAIMHEPALLILDEPTVGVDPRAKESIHDLLLELRARGLAILLTTHDMEQATQIADQVGIIAAGHLRVQGTPTELIERAYGSDRELVASFEVAPTAKQTQLLSEMGLAPLRGTRVWAGRFPADYERVAEFDRAVEAAGPKLSEIALREPTLTGVFHRLAGEDLSL
jgi:ABC-2 type transport system ATP-binding protein